MPSPIKTTLPEKYLQLLGVWVNLMFNPADLPGYIQYLHQEIQSKDDQRLSDYERLVLKSLLSCKDINRDNLYDFYCNYSKLKPSLSFWEKLLNFKSQIPDYDQIYSPSKDLITQDEGNSKNRELWYWVNISIEEAFKNHQYELAEEFFSKYSTILDVALYKKLRKESFKEYYLEIEQVLRQYRFTEADDMYLKFADSLDQPQYESLKAKFIAEYFESNFNEKGKPFKLDSEQADAVGALGHNILVSARAGSGKTRVLAAKILYLLEQENLNESEICVLAFNKNVPDEILKRVNQNIQLNALPDKYSQIKVARTFHSLAKKLANCDDRILAEEKSGMIKNIVEHLKITETDFLETTYRFLKNGNLNVGKKSFDNESDYYEYLRNSKYSTIRGEEVKSAGEKIIADFLFEHGVEYMYEKTFYPASCEVEDLKIKKELKGLGKEMHPDFFLPQYNLVWEHWAIDETDQSAEAKLEFANKFNSTWEDYYNQMQKKRWLWGDWRKKEMTTENPITIAFKEIEGLIETKASDLLEGREKYEKTIEETLIKFGVKLQKPNYQELYEMTWAKAHDRLTGLMEQFINRYQQQYFDDKHNFVELIKTEYKENDRLTYFAELGFQVLDEYEKQLKLKYKAEYLKEFNQYSLDFNQLIAKAIDEIADGKADEYVKNIKWILIDEYQDFSKLFFKLVDAIKNRNSEVKLFCVGDSWQAINRFAGAETKYFDDFQTYFPDCTIKNITTNYRSFDEVISSSNEFMRRSGFSGIPAKAFQKGPPGQVEIINIGKTYIFHKEGYSGDMDYLRQIPEFRGAYNRKVFAIAQYLKLCVDIVNRDSDKRFLFLVRTNLFLGKDKSWFIDALKRILLKKHIYQSFEEALEHVSIETMHGSKGLERDVVVLFKVEKRIIPMFHQDADLFQIFGESYNTIIADQERLFYVAVTRAKEKIYVVTKTGHESWFLKAY